MLIMTDGNKGNYWCRRLNYRGSLRCFACWQLSVSRSLMTAEMSHYRSYAVVFTTCWPLCHSSPSVTLLYYVHQEFVTNILIFIWGIIFFELCKKTKFFFLFTTLSIKSCAHSNLALSFDYNNCAHSNL